MKVCGAGRMEKTNEGKSGASTALYTKRYTIVCGTKGSVALVLAQIALYKYAVGEEGESGCS